jgi:hypothetical protein
MLLLLQRVMLYMKRNKWSRGMCVYVNNSLDSDATKCDRPYRPGYPHVAYLKHVFSATHIHQELQAFYPKPTTVYFPFSLDNHCELFRF